MNATNPIESVILCFNVFNLRLSITMPATEKSENVSSLMNVNTLIFVEHFPRRLFLSCFGSVPFCMAFENVVLFNSCTREVIEFCQFYRFGFQLRDRRRRKINPRNYSLLLAVWWKIAAIFLGIYHLSECSNNAVVASDRHTRWHSSQMNCGCVAIVNESFYADEVAAVSSTKFKMLRLNLWWHKENGKRYTTTKERKKIEWFVNSIKWKWRRSEYISATVREEREKEQSKINGHDVWKSIKTILYDERFVCFVFGIFVYLFDWKMK